MRCTEHESWRFLGDLEGYRRGNGQL